MTTVPIEFQIDNKKGTVRLYGLTEPLTPNSLASNINFVQWDGVTNTGKISYNDRFPLPELLTDPSPYQAQINQWLTSASNPVTGGLSFSQAVAVKSSLIDSIWAVKRQAAVSVVTSLGTFSFDSSDVSEQTSLLAALLSLVASVGNLATSVNSAFSTLTTKLNTDLANLPTDINAMTYNGLQGQVTADLDQIVNAVNPLLNVPITLTYQPIVAQQIPSFANISGISASYSFPTPSINPELLPAGRTSYPAFTDTDLLTVLSAIQTQRSNELLVRASKQAALAALSTTAAVIAYDATTGW